MHRFLVLNQPYFDGFPGAPGSPMHEVYAWKHGEPRWEDIDVNAQWSVVVDADTCRLAFIKAMGMEPHSHSGTQRDGVTSFTIKSTDKPDFYSHVWVIQLDAAMACVPR